MLSFWEKDIYFQESDVLLAGAGFSGLWMAFFLKKTNPKLRITVIERSHFSGGASTKNAGFACFGSPSELLSNCKEMGKDEAIFWAIERYKGIRKIEEIFGNVIDYQPSGGYEVYDSKEIYEENTEAILWLNKEFANETNHKNVFSVQNDAVETFGFEGFKYLIKNEAEGAIHSGKLFHALKLHVEASGVKVITGVELKNYTENADNVTVETSLGTLKTRHLCLTMNAFLPSVLKETGILPGRGQVLITEPIENLRLNGTFHYDEGYVYFRNYENRILLGGARNLDFSGETSNEFELNPTIQQHLEELLFTKIAPYCRENIKIAHRWAGIMAFDETKKPLAKVIRPTLSVCGRMNGMGVALAPTLAENLSHELAKLL